MVGKADVVSWPNNRNLINQQQTGLNNPLFGQFGSSGFTGTPFLFPTQPFTSTNQQVNPAQPTQINPTQPNQANVNRLNPTNPLAPFNPVPNQFGFNQPTAFGSPFAGGNPFVARGFNPNPSRGAYPGSASPSGQQTKK